MAQHWGRGMGKALLALAATMALAALGLGQGPAKAEELRIGYVAPMTGIFAQVGKDMTDGFQMYLDEVNHDMAGAKVTFIVEDTQAKPPINVQKAEKLIRQDKVHMYIGGLLASTGYALAPVSTRNKTVYIMPVAAADDLTQRQNYPYLIRTGWTSSQPSHPFGQWACEKGYKRIATIGADYAFGYEVIGGFHKSFEDCGGKIVQKIWAPLGTKDFGPFLPQIKHDVDAVFTLMVGPMSLAFPKQYKAAGLKAPLLGGGTSADEFALPFMGDEAIGYTTALQYAAALDTPKNIAFVKKYRKLYGKVPSYYSETNYTTAEWIHEVMKKTGGKWPGAEKFVQIFKGIKLDSIRGPVELDDQLNPIENIYIRTVEKKKNFGYPDAELWNTIVKTYPHVSQYYNYDKAKFLKQPVYSRDFPPCTHCE
jgi:branched-chain amino acid transport system substrate-binding protein